MATPDLILCNGGNPTFRAIARECGWRNGARLPDTVYDPPLFFADQEYRKPDRAAYRDAVAQHRPVMATVLDWERLEQLAEVLAWAEEIAPWVAKVVVIPKIPGTLEQIPRRIGGKEVILGYSVPTSYGGTLVPVWEFQGWPVHLLGGSPQKQMDLCHYLNVVSCDGGMAQQQARKCRFWSAAKGSHGFWVQLSETGDNRQEGAPAECLRRSLENIRRSWEWLFSSRLR